MVPAGSWRGCATCGEFARDPEWSRRAAVIVGVGDLDPIPAGFLDLDLAHGVAALAGWQQPTAQIALIGIEHMERDIELFRDLVDGDAKLAGLRRIDHLPIGVAERQDVTGVEARE